MATLYRVGFGVWAATLYWTVVYVQSAATDNEVWLAGESRRADFEGISTNWGGGVGVWTGLRGGQSSPATGFRLAHLGLEPDGTGLTRQQGAGEFPPQDSRPDLVGGGGEVGGPVGLGRLGDVLQPAAEAVADHEVGGGLGPGVGIA